MNLQVFFDIEIGSKPIGRIEMELFADVTPKTSEVRVHVVSRMRVI